MIIANMQMASWKPWIPRLAAFGVALLLAASVVYWVMRWPARDAGTTVPLASVRQDLPVAGAADVARLLGASAVPVASGAAPEASSRFRLTGIVALGSGKGVALVSVDGNPAKPYRVGSPLDDAWVLQSVGPRSVSLGAQATGPSSLELELPKPR